MEEQEQPKPKKRYKLKTDTIIAVSAVLISLCALIMTFMETNIMRTQQQASNYPHLILSKGYSGEGFHITVSNKGPGLAFIKTFYFWYENETGEKVYFENWLEIANHFLPEGHGVDYGVLRTTTINESVITGGESHKIFQLPYSRDSVKYADEFIFEHIPKLQYQLCYCSILDECWILSSGHFTPEACRKCKLIVDAKEFDSPVN